MSYRSRDTRRDRSRSRDRGDDRYSASNSRQSDRDRDRDRGRDRDRDRGRVDMGKDAFGRDRSLAVRGPPSRAESNRHDRSRTMHATSAAASSSSSPLSSVARSSTGDVYEDANTKLLAKREKEARLAQAHRLMKGGRDDAEEDGEEEVVKAAPDTSSTASTTAALPVPSMGAGANGGDDDVDMMALMGFGGFDSSKGKLVEDNWNGAARGAVLKTKKKEYRQYMNRKGGFNKPLAKVA